MRHVTLLLSGVPQYVKLPDLSFNLDCLFNTDEIGTFKIRDLPNHPVTNKRQIALDFMSSFDAMAAHEKLEGYQYEMEDGRQYMLRAKINKAEEYMCSKSQSPEPCGNSSWYGADWQALALIPSLDNEMYHRANARLDAQLDLLRKQQLVIEKEKKILKEKHRLKREYGSMHAYDESESSSSKRSRSRVHRSSSWHRRSRSKESKERGLPQIEWSDQERAKNTGHRSRSKDRTRPHKNRTRAQKSGSQESRDPSPRYGSRQRSGSKEHGSLRDTIQRDQRSGSRKRVYRESSKEQVMHSKEHGNRDKRSSVERNLRELRPMSRDRMARSKERSRSSERRPRSKERSRTYRKSSSRERAHRYYRCTSKERDYRMHRSKERGLPQIEWPDQERAKNTDHRSRSKDRTRPHENRTRAQKSGSQEPRDPSPRYGTRQRSGSKEHESSRDTIQRDRRSGSRKRVHRESSKEQVMHSKEHGNREKRSSVERNLRELRSMSRDRMARSKERSRSRERRPRSKERSRTYRKSSSRERAHRYYRCTSKERDYRMHRSRSKEPIQPMTRTRERSRTRNHMPSSHEQRSTYRRSRSRDLTFHSNDRTMSRSHRRSRSSERRPKPLAIMPRSPKQLMPPIRTIVSYKDDCSFKDNIKRNTSVHSENVFVKVEELDANKDNNEATANKNKTCNLMDDKSKKTRSKEEKTIAKFNSKIKKIEMIESRVKEFTNDVMVLIIILLEKLMDKDKVRISASNKMLLTKKFETVVAERLEPLARKKKITDVEVLRKYKKLYPREVELVMIKQMLDKIPKIKVVESQSTVTVSTEYSTPHIPEPITSTVEDIEEQKDYENNVSPSENVIPCESRNENIEQEPIIIDLGNELSSPTIKKEKIQEKPIIIDIDSAEKPVPRHPQFVVVIKFLIKKMKKVGLDKLLETHYIKITQFRYVLRNILRQLLKGQAYIPRKDIISKFREVHPQDKDEEFVKNVFKDINSGKYPRCTDVKIITEDNGPGDPEAVVLLEKQHEVVTVADSDDDYEKKPIMEVINHESVRGRDMPKLSTSPENSSPTKVSPAVYIDPGHIAVDDAKPIASHDQAMTGGTNLSKRANPTKQKTKKKKKEKKTANTVQGVTQSAVVESIDSQGTQDVSNSGDSDSTRTDTEIVEDIHAVDDGLKKRTIQISNYGTKNNQVDNRNNRENSEENDSNNLKVTAITIMTSLDDLLAKTSNTRESEAEPIKDIKEELQYEEDRPDDSSLQLVPDSGPIVTSITIMTSDAELFSIGQEDGHKKVSEIKEEEDTCFDAEETLLNDIEKDINNDKFSLQMNKEYDSNNLQTVLPGQSPSLSNSEFISHKPQDNKTEDEDETIECIGRYVASLF